MTFGLSAENVLLPFLYIIVPFLPVIFAVAFLFAVVTTVARLSLDGEIVAIQSRGMSLLRFAAAPLSISIVLGGITAGSAHYFEAWGRREFVQFIYKKTHIEIDNVLHTKLQEKVFLHDFLDYVLYAEKISKDRTTLQNVLVASSRDSKNKFVLTAKTAKLLGTISSGSLQVEFFDGFAYTIAGLDDEEIKTGRFREATVDLLSVFHERILGQPHAEEDFRAFPPEQLYRYIDELAEKPQENSVLLHKARFLWHARSASALLVISFALLGVMLGLHDPRSIKAPIFLKTIATVIICFSVSSLFRWLADNGKVDALIAAWLPQLLLLLAAGWGLLRRNQVPIAQGLFSFRPRGG